MLDLASYYQVYNFSHLAAIHRASHGSRKLYFNLLYLYNINQNFEALLEMTCQCCWYSVWVNIFIQVKKKNRTTTRFHFLEYVGKKIFLFLRIKIKQKDSRQKVVLQLIRSRPTLPDYRQFGLLSVPIQRWSFLFPVAFIVSPYYSLINLHKSTASSTLDKSKDSLSLSLCIWLSNPLPVCPTWVPHQIILKQSDSCHVRNVQENLPRLIWVTVM